MLQVPYCGGTHTVADKMHFSLTIPPAWQSLRERIDFVEILLYFAQVMWLVVSLKPLVVRLKVTFTINGTC